MSVFVRVSGYKNWAGSKNGKILSTQSLNDPQVENFYFAHDSNFVRWSFRTSIDKICGISKFLSHQVQFPSVVPKLTLAYRLTMVRRTMRPSTNLSFKGLGSRGCQIGMQGPQLCAKPRHFFKLDVATSRMFFLDLNLHVLQVATSKLNN